MAAGRCTSLRVCEGWWMRLGWIWMGSSVMPAEPLPPGATLLAQRCSHEDGESLGMLLHRAGSFLPLPKPFCDFQKPLSCMEGGSHRHWLGAPPGTAPHCGTRSMTNIIIPAKANPCWPRLLGCTPRKTVFPCKDEAMNILCPRRIFLSGGCCMNYGEVGRRRRVLLAGVGSELEAALAPRGFTSGLLPWVLGKVCPSLPTTAAIRACWRSLWCKSIPVWGSLCSPAEQVGARRVNGAVLAQGWMQDGCSAASLEVCEGGTAASLGTWRGEARNGALPCFPLMPGWVLEVLVLGAGLTQHPAAFQSRCCCSPVPSALPPAHVLHPRCCCHPAPARLVGKNEGVVFHAIPGFHVR